MAIEQECNGKQNSCLVCTSVGVTVQDSAKGRKEKSSSMSVKKPDFWADDNNSISILVSTDTFFDPTNAVIKHLGERSVTEVGCFIVQQYILTLKLHQSTKTPNFNFNLILYFFFIIKHFLRIIDSRKRDGGGNNCKSYSYYLWCKIRRRRIMVELIHLTPTTIFANVNHIFPPIHLTMTQLCWILTSCQLRFYVICRVSESFLITFSVINNLDI